MSTNANLPSSFIELATDFDISLEWLATGRGPMPLGVGETRAAYRRLTDNEDRLLDALHMLPESKRHRLLSEFEMTPNREQMQAIQLRIELLFD